MKPLQLLLILILCSVAFLAHAKSKGKSASNPESVGKSDVESETNETDGKSKPNGGKAKSKTIGKSKENKAIGKSKPGKTAGKSKGNKAIGKSKAEKASGKSKPSLGKSKLGKMVGKSKLSQIVGKSKPSKITGKSKLGKATGKSNQKELKSKSMDKSVSKLNDTSMELNPEGKEVVKAKLIEKKSIVRSKSTKTVTITKSKKSVAKSKPTKSTGKSKLGKATGKSNQKEIKSKSKDKSEPEVESNVDDVPTELKPEGKEVVKAKSIEKKSKSTKPFAKSKSIQPVVKSKNPKSKSIKLVAKSTSTKPVEKMKSTKATARSKPIVKSSSIKSKSNKSKSNKSKSSKSNLIESEPIKSESIKSESIKSESIKSESIKSESTKSKSIKSKSIKPKSLKSLLRSKQPPRFLKPYKSTNEADYESLFEGINVTDSMLLPSLVSITYIKYHICSGSIISDHFILTVAHCLFDGLTVPLPKDNMLVVVGINEESYGSSYEIHGMYTHENFDNHTYSNDVALIKTIKPIQMGPDVRTIGLRGGDLFDDRTSVFATTSWYGRPKFDRNFDGEVFNVVDVRSIPIDTCKKSFLSVSIRHICMTSVATRGDCNEDSGGPLVVASKNGVEQIGILSFSINCGVGKPEVYTRVSWYFNWIKRGMERIK